MSQEELVVLRKELTELLDKNFIRTLNQIGRAKWFTKLDVSAAFHKIWIAKGQEWMTAFRTRYGLFEWLVTPFGLANAPSTFQKYIN
ncbi:hypothetical protein AN0536.2 [Aspergillus nidulans FGSC A4]|uniref:Reverse transcriptase domain-containing protein n=1 Tax=Emericella nidulans (strain FGSC A4 / ATCC 38163 / CBS 112.46 / NRRL 194 / M139) TaxID=227321 RepID=Q5BFZ4_EMENI|nr:hypothetical protein [Aspergillus nidulans FGSC A4]EAA66635.1 hypothetical protein AN0536.2 [Aspergillus nidulans FGSC A4]CBF89286.1 TPA: conserved hypothetical protein [Aspergillus nidulans FGSC A4]|eukprot:XP_658140.1 hypothetical protein AN0536.2 [Aspergillus nidulans FGSC A4]